jgi:hypothetical protein
MNKKNENIALSYKYFCRPLIIESYTIVLGYQIPVN